MAKKTNKEKKTKGEKETKKVIIREFIETKFKEIKKEENKNGEIEGENEEASVQEESKLENEILETPRTRGRVVAPVLSSEERTQELERVANAAPAGAATRGADNTESSKNLYAQNYTSKNPTDYSTRNVNYEAARETRADREMPNQAMLFSGAERRKQTLGEVFVRRAQEIQLSQEPRRVAESLQEQRAGEEREPEMTKYGIAEKMKKEDALKRQQRRMMI